MQSLTLRPVYAWRGQMRDFGPKLGLSPVVAAKLVAGFSCYGKAALVDV